MTRERHRLYAALGRLVAEERAYAARLREAAGHAKDGGDATAAAHHLDQALAADERAMRAEREQAAMLRGGRP